MRPRLVVQPRPPVPPLAGGRCLEEGFDVDMSPSPEGYPSQWEYLEALHLAREECAICPCMAECREWGLQDPLVGGVLGGLSEDQRRRRRW